MPPEHRQVSNRSDPFESCSAQRRRLARGARRITPPLRISRCLSGICPHRGAARGAASPWRTRCRLAHCCDPHRLLLPADSDRRRFGAARLSCPLCGNLGREYFTRHSRTLVASPYGTVPRRKPLVQTDGPVSDLGRFLRRRKSRARAAVTARIANGQMNRPKMACNRAAVSLV